MPVQQCQVGTKSGWKYGKSGKCYIGKGAKQQAIQQGLAIGEGRLNKDHYKKDSKISQQVFVESMAIKSDKPIKYPTKQPAINYPIGLEKKYQKYLRSIMKRFIDITNTWVTPELSTWRQAQLQFTNDAYIRDAWEDDLEDVKETYIEEQNKILKDQAESLIEELFFIASSIYVFTDKQWDKVVKSVFGTTVNTVDAWETPFLNQWVKNNVNLITGMLDDYRKQMYNLVSTGVTNKDTVATIKAQIAKLNKKFTKSRVNLIGRDQVSKLHGQIVEQKQLDVGIQLYTWVTAFDERVRSKHKPLHNKTCKWSNASIYSDDGGETWWSRSNIGAVMLHPGQDFQCRCYAEAYWNGVIDEVNNKIAA